MNHDAFHHHGHGLSGARILACLDPLDGLTTQALCEATGLHRTTVQRRLRRLVDDGLAQELDGRYCLAPALAGPTRLHPQEDFLDDSAHRRGTSGRGCLRRHRHRAERDRYQQWLAERHARRTRRPRPTLVPDGVVDPTGVLLDERWRGWDLSDPYHPTWRGDPATDLPHPQPGDEHPRTLHPRRAVLASSTRL
ncbi:winged helix-turn-helix domain-containing protein [Streptomyces sp. NBC_00696]|uniref:winged helix-turn-helix domain-containing protein n=1 Tax=Streptomyces sp. NBC_00696 TaxID=2903672 RepID=UPI003FA791DB